MRTLALLLLLSACGGANQITLESVNKSLKKVKANNPPEVQSELTAPHSLYKNNVEVPILAKNLIQTNTDLFMESFCKSLETGELDQTHAAKIFNPQGANQWGQYGEFFKRNQMECDGLKNLLSAKPNTINQLSLKDKDFTLMISLRNDQKGLIETIYMMGIPKNFVFEKTMLKVGNNAELGTYSLYIKDRKAPVIFIKTPYLSYGIRSSLAQAEQYLSMGFHVVLQSNRGSYESTGSFKWLHIENVEDQRKTIDWITKQDFYQTGVIATGTSYDGFNALTAAATNHESLKAVIACSAPVNAETDSFTANKIVEFAHLMYLTSVKEGYRFDIYNQAREQILKGVKLADLDNKLLGRDEAEWDEVLASANQKTKYYERRNLNPLLKNVKVPTLIAGGFHEDQDGRDTLLNFEQIKDNPNVGGYFHQYGHGCGKMMQEPFYGQILGEVARNLPVTSIKKLIVKYSDEEKYESDTPVFPMQDKQLEMVSVLTKTNPNESLGIGFVDDFIYGKEAESRTVFVSAQQISEETKLFGSIKITLNLKSYSPYNALNLSAYYMDKNNQFYPISRLLTSTQQSRTQVLIKKHDKTKKIELMLPPVVAKIPEGARLVVELSSQNKFSFPMRLNTRKEHKKWSPNELGLVLTKNPVITLSTK